CRPARAAAARRPAGSTRSPPFRRRAARRPRPRPRARPPLRPPRTASSCLSRLERRRRAAHLAGGEVEAERGERRLAARLRRARRAASGLAIVEVDAVEQLREVE